MTKQISLNEEEYDRLRIYIAINKHKTFSDGIKELLDKNDQ